MMSLLLTLVLDFTLCNNMTIIKEDCTSYELLMINISFSLFHKVGSYVAINYRVVWILQNFMPNNYIIGIILRSIAGNRECLLSYKITLNLPLSQITFYYCSWKNLFLFKKLNSRLLPCFPQNAASSSCIMHKNL